MILKRLFGRKKPFSPPPPEDRAGPIRSIRDHPDAGFRREACRRTEYLSELRNLATSDPDAGVREVASAHYRRLLCGQKAEGPDLAQRLEELATLEDQNLLQQVALTGREAELRRAAITELRSQDMIAACALTDPLAINRSLAVERLDHKEALEQIVKRIGKKDKQVYRTARRKLGEIAEREALPARIRARCDELCGKLERLGRRGRWEQDRALLELSDQQWQQIAQDVDVECEAHYRELHDRFLRAYEEQRSAHEAQVVAADQEVMRAERHTLIRDLEALAALDDTAAITQELTRIAARWDELAPRPKWEQSSLAHKYAAAHEAAAAKLTALTTGVRDRTQLEELLTRAEQALEQTEPLEQKRVRGLMKAVGKLLNATAGDPTVATRYAGVREALDERLRTQMADAEQRLKQLPKQLDKLTEAIEKGRLKAAEPLYRRIDADIKQIRRSGLPPRTYEEAAARLRSLRPELRDLQGWRRWGADQSRQELCQAMEELATQDLSHEARVLRWRDLRTAWKQLGNSGPSRSQTSWKRFRTASESVYEYCRPYLEAQAAERAANHRQREQLCRTLEDFLDQADWEHMDWKQVIRAQREIRATWSDSTPPEGRHGKDLEQRFQAAMRRLDGQLAQERSRNLAHKHELIVQVEALAKEPDPDRAIEETKRLQQAWYTSVATWRKEENRLWQRFRAACNAVFIRHRQQQETHTAELAENLRQHEALCAEAEALAESDADTDGLTAQLRELDRRRRDAETLPIPRQSAAGLSRRWQTARSLVEARRREHLEARRHEVLDLLATQAALCERLERTLEAGTATASVATAVAADWQALPTQHDPGLQAAIEKRFDRALEACRQGGETQQAWNDALAVATEQRAELCLHLEVLAQVDSPPELAEKRLQLQVTRLTRHLRGSEQEPQETATRLLQQWYLCDPIPASAARALEERFLRARNAIEAMRPSKP